LQNNGGDSLTVTANGSFTFKTPVTGADVYVVTVVTQPVQPQPDLHGDEWKRGCERKSSPTWR